MDEHQMGRRTASGLLFTKAGSILLFRDKSNHGSSNHCTRVGCTSKQTCRAGMDRQSQASTSQSLRSKRRERTSNGEVLDRSTSTAGECSSVPASRAWTSRNSFSSASVSRTTRPRAPATSQANSAHRRIPTNSSVRTHDDVTGNPRRRLQSTSGPLSKPRGGASSSNQTTSRSRNARVRSSSRPDGNEAQVSHDSLLDDNDWDTNFQQPYLHPTGWGDTTDTWDQTLVRLDQTLGDLYRETRMDRGHSNNVQRLRRMNRENSSDVHHGMRMDIDGMSYEELLALSESIGMVNTGLSEESLAECLERRVYQTSASIACTQHCDINCVICQEDYAVGEEISEMICHHSYHTTCILQWLRLKNWCPICKAFATS